MASLTSECRARLLHADNTQTICARSGLVQFPISNYAKDSINIHSMDPWGSIMQQTFCKYSIYYVYYYLKDYDLKSEELFNLREQKCYESKSGTWKDLFLRRAPYIFYLNFGGYNSHGGKHASTSGYGPGVHFRRGSKSALSPVDAILESKCRVEWWNVNSYSTHSLNK